MSSFGTEKFQTTSLRLGMPSAFQDAYASSGNSEEFAPEQNIGGLDITIGNDFQSKWHEQKMKDAHHMSRQKVHSTKMMYNRSNSAPNGVYGMPKPVLGQRKYANPSAGSLQSGSARQDYEDSPFHYSSALSGGSSDERLVGGVLRSAQGQSYGMRLLQNRIADFDKLTAMKEEFSSGMPMRTEMGVSPFAGVEPTTAQQVSGIPLIELSQLLQSVLDSLQDGEGGTESASQFTYKDSVRALSLIVRLATSGGAEDIQDVLEFVEGGSSGDGILPKLQDIVIQPINEENEPPKNARLYLSLKEFWERIKIYLNNMLKTVGLPMKSRVNASQAYLKSLKFTKLFSGKLPEEFVNPQDEQQGVDDRAWEDMSSRWGRSWQGQSDSSSDFSGRDRQPIRREDSQHGYTGTGDVEFSHDDRQRFGYASGEYSTGGRGVGYIGEDGLEYEQVPSMNENQSAEQEEGQEQYEDNALNTIPTNDGARLVSRRDETTGEYDVVPPPSTRKVITLKKQPGLTITRDDLTGLSTADYQALAKRVNEFYKGTLPDGKGVISVSAYSKPKSIRQNFIRRLNL